MRVIVYPAFRGRGNGTAILSALADRSEGAGRLVYAAFDTGDARSRSASSSPAFALRITPSSGGLGASGAGDRFLYRQGG